MSQIVMPTGTKARKVDAEFSSQVLLISLLMCDNVLGKISQMIGQAKENLMWS